MSKIKLNLDKNLSKEYYNAEEDGLYPISEVDVEILSILKESIVNRSATRDKVFLTIFSSYKTNLPDKQVLNDLKKWRDWYDDNPQVKFEIENGEYEGEPGQETQEEPRRNVVEIMGELIPVNHINRVSKRMELKSGRPQYLVVLNESPLESHISNIKFSFKSERERDQVFQDLSDKLSEFMNIIFVR